VGVSQSPRSGRSLCELAAQSVRRHEVDELLPTVDLDDRDQLAVARLELGIAVDRHLLELEPELLTRRDERLPRTPAQVAALGAVQPDDGYG
jgi:hypothetical protein